MEHGEQEVLHTNPNSETPKRHPNPKSVRPGISVLLDERRDLLHDKRVGVLSNASGVLPALQSSVDALVNCADVRAIFSPEHGLRGAAAEGAHIGDDLYRERVPIYSLYGAQLAPTKEGLAELDVIVCDIQDVGCRFYTYAWTVIKLIEAAAQHKISVIIADRPNPIGGVGVEGPGVAPDYRTLVGLHDVPIRHGLTLGELARLVNGEADLGCDLQVVPCHGWQRHPDGTRPWADTNLPWVPPSPNMPTADMALVYPGTCLLEGINVSVGRGTSKPFEWLGAPWIDGEGLAGALNNLQLPGVRWRPVAFTPCAQPYAGAVCEGVQPHVTDIDIFKPVEAGVALLMMLHRLHGEWIMFNIAHFDRLAGSTRVRQLIQAGATHDEIVTPWQAYEQHWRERTQPWLLYR